MSNEKILLEFREKDLNELVKNQAKAESAFNSLVEYCEETLMIKIEDLKAFYQNPKQYCIDQYWKKYGLQYGDAPILKEKAIEMTAWSGAAFESHHKAAKVAFNFLAAHQYEIGKTEVSFNANEEEYKKYVRDEDQEDYNLALEFIEVAKRLEARGGKPVRNLAQYSDLLMVDGKGLAPSKIYFTSLPRMRKDFSQFL